NVVDILPGNFFDLETILWRVRHQLFKASFPVSAKAMIVSDHELACPQCFNENFSDKFFGSVVRKFFRKWNADEVVDARFFHQLGFLFESVQQLECIFFGMKDQPGVGPEGEDHRLSLMSPGDLYQARQDFLVSQVDAVKGSARHHCIVETHEIIQSMINLHSLYL